MLQKKEKEILKNLPFFLYLLKWRRPLPVSQKQTEWK